METLAPAPAPAGIDPARLEACLRVLEEAEALPLDHPDAVAVQRATARIYKSVKLRRRSERRDAILAHDRAVTAATATGAPGRIDDETEGLPLVPSVRGASAGELREARACYVCKQRYTVVDAFYHQLCPDCAHRNHARRDARTDLTGRRALLTGGRAKIGMYIALRLLRDGAHTTITTRFPNDAVRRFAQMPDSAEWLDRLKVVGIDLRDPAQVVALAASVAADGPLDVLINNAAQTVRRSPAAYAPLVAAEQAPLPAGPLPEVVTFGRTHAGRHALGAGAHWTPTPEALTAMALTAGSASPARAGLGTGSAVLVGDLRLPPDDLRLRDIRHAQHDGRTGREAKIVWAGKGTAARPPPARAAPGARRAAAAQPGALLMGDLRLLPDDCRLPGA